MMNDADRMGVLTAMEGLASVRTAAQLVDCVRSTLLELIPHEIFVFGAGNVKGRGFTDHKPLGHKFPLQYLDEMRQPDGRLQTPSIARWLRTGEPQVYESTTRDTRDPFDRYDLCNMAAHGVVDRGSATFFSFFQIADHVGEKHKRVLRLLAPHLHVALRTCVDELPAPYHLGPQQREVAKLLAIGKTNWEIAVILGTSERNAKYHVEEIIRKLGVVNRTEAAAKAAALGIV